MTAEQKRRTLFVGVDVHKDTHTAVGVSPFGEKLFELTVGNYQKDFRSLTEAAESVSAKEMLSPYFGLEDCSGFGERLSGFLLDEGYSVVHVPPILVDERRKNETHPEKSDSLDALGVAKVMLQRSDTLLPYTLTPEALKAKQIKEISVDREFLVSERTRLKNQLHTLLHRIWNTEYRTKFKDPFSLKALRHWKARTPKSADPFLVRSMRRKVGRLLDLHKEITELESELETLLKESGHTIQTASGCGTILAAMIVGEVGDINRFHSPAALAKYAGLAPKQKSSGKTIRHVKSKSGNRKLNMAIHRIALSQISKSGNQYAKEYFKKKMTEGKSKNQALFCLKRKLVNIIYMMLKHKQTYNYQK